MLLLAALCIGASAQTFSGVIATESDSGRQLPIPFATVYIPALHQGTMTDAQGKFAISGLPASTYVVEYSCIGYATQRDTISFAPRATSLAALVEQKRSGSESDIARHVVLAEQAIRLPEVFVGNTDENPALAVVRELNTSNAANLRRIVSLGAAIDIDVTQNLSTLPDKLIKMAKMVIWMTPYRKLFNLMLEHPELTYGAQFNMTYNGKKEVQSNLHLTRCVPELGAQDQKTLVKVFETDEYCLRSLRLDKESRFHPKNWDKYDWELIGTYEEGGRMVDVVRSVSKNISEKNRAKYGTQYHIIHLDDDTAKTTAGVSCALLRVRHSKGVAEFRELTPGLYLPVSRLGNLVFDDEEKSDFNDQMQHKRDSIAETDMNNRQRVKAERELDEKQKIGEGLMDVTLKTASSIRYTNVKVK